MPWIGYLQMVVNHHTSSHLPALLETQLTTKQGLMSSFESRTAQLHSKSFAIISHVFLTTCAIVCTLAGRAIFYSMHPHSRFPARSSRCEACFVSPFIVCSSSVHRSDTLRMSPPGDYIMTLRKYCAAVKSLIFAPEAATGNPIRSALAAHRSDLSLSSGCFAAQLSELLLFLRALCCVPIMLAPHVTCLCCS